VTLSERLKFGKAAIVLAMAALSACTGLEKPKAKSPLLADSTQLVLVTPDSFEATQGQLRSFQRDASGQWRLVLGPWPVNLGRTGSAWGLGLHQNPPAVALKREGDGKAPAGVFEIGTAFGYKAELKTALPYLALSASHYCIDDVASPLYNQIVDSATVGTAAVANSTEPMRRDIHLDGDMVYQQGFVIAHNAGGQAGAGSCIFVHERKGESVPTAGCTALVPEHLSQLLAWLRPEANPRFVLVPNAELEPNREAWGLPEID
jgi:L,D-peptidoglycan transpeptidase YkuD (ErfK/YbiS/YcfS/YnhG family)